MKKIGLLIFSVFVMFGFAVTAHAASSVNLSCDSTTIKIGESANCIVAIQSETAVTATTITLDVSEYLEVSNITANSSAGWTASETGTNKATNLYAFNNTTGATGSSQVFSFTVTLSQKASQLSEGDSCGQLCISAATFNGAALTGILQGTGTCFAPTVVLDQCVGEACNPQTGVFMNYVIIVSVGIIAIGAIMIARRSNRFYRI